jgi:hypothetical protein
MGGNGPVIDAGLAADVAAFGLAAAVFGLAAALRAGVLRAAGAALFVTFLVWRVAAMEQFS